MNAIVIKTDEAPPKRWPMVPAVVALVACGVLTIVVAFAGAGPSVATLHARAADAVTAGDDLAAILHDRHLLALQPNHPEHAVRLAEALDRLGRRGEAMAVLGTIAPAAGGGFAPAQFRQAEWLIEARVLHGATDAATLAAARAHARAAAEDPAQRTGGDGVARPDRRRVAEGRAVSAAAGDDKSDVMPSPRRVLFVDHTSRLGGGEIALLNLIGALDRSRYTPVALLFADGPLREKLAAAGVETRVVPLAASIAEARKEDLGRGWFGPARHGLTAMRFVASLRRAIRVADVSIVHTNSLKADVLGGVAARLAGVPVVWHVRDRIADDYLPPRVVRLFRRLARWVPTAIVANSRATLATLECNVDGSLPACRPKAGVGGL